jgi:sulfate adenylyltransferase subunit 2
MSNQATPSAQNPRRLAVELRLDGQPLQAIKDATQLSSPTIIALHNAYLNGGWEAVDTKRKSGRPQQSKNKDTPALSQMRQELFYYQAQAINDGLWDKTILANSLSTLLNKKVDERKALRLLEQCEWLAPTYASMKESYLTEALYAFKAKAKSLSLSLLAVSSIDSKKDLATEKSTPLSILFARGTKDELLFKIYSGQIDDAAYCDFYKRLLTLYPKGIATLIEFAGFQYTPKLAQWLNERNKEVKAYALSLQTIPTTSAQGTETKSGGEALLNAKGDIKLAKSTLNKNNVIQGSLTHLQRLEAESIHIMREVIAEANKPVMLYSIGKDSAVMLHIALKAFYPAKLPFPLLHVDTRWKFQAMYRFRDQMVKDHDLDLLIHTNPEGLAMGINPFTHGSQIHTDIMKTQALKQALDQYDFDVAFGGARRDEEKSRAKERIFSFRNAQHHWDPKQQRPELWNLYNVKKNVGESIRVFPLSNWTELDIWQYIYLENIPIVPLYYSQKRPVVERNNTLIMVDDDRMPLEAGEIPQMKSVRFRTLGCYPLTGAIESSASSLPEIIQEMLLTKTSERQGRVIDHDGAASMEKKKQEGYF